MSNRSNFPGYDDFDEVVGEIYKNRYFSNHGPLARELEFSLGKFLGQKNVVTVSSDALALLIAVSGYFEKGVVMVPAFGYQNIIDVVNISGLDVVCCDVDKRTHQISIETFERSYQSNIRSLIVSEMWGNKCDPQLIDYAHKKGVKVITYSETSFASSYKSNNQNIMSVYSLGNADSVPYTLEGGVIATNYNEYAEKFRNIRSSYGVREMCEVVATCNGRFSELQAGLGLIALEKMSSLMSSNNEIISRYKEYVKNIDDISAYEVGDNVKSNYQTLTVILDKESTCTRSSIIEVLKKDGINFSVYGTQYFGNGDEFPVAKFLSTNTLVITLCESTH